MKTVLDNKMLFYNSRSIKRSKTHFHPVKFITITSLEPKEEEERKKDHKNYLSYISSSHEFPEEEIQSRSTKFEQLNASPCSLK